MTQVGLSQAKVETYNTQHFNKQNNTQLDAECVQGILTVGKGSVQLTLNQPVYYCYFALKKPFDLLIQTSYLSEEINCTRPSPLDSVPC